MGKWKGTKKIHPASIFITFRGITDTMKGWSRRTGVPYITIKRRYRRGWTPEQIINGGGPRRKRFKYIKAVGGVSDKEGWSYATGVHPDTIQYRLDMGHCNEAAVYTEPRERDDYCVEFNGCSYSYGQWSQITGLKSTTIQARIRVCGWTVEEALCTPLHGKKGTDFLPWADKYFRSR